MNAPAPPPPNYSAPRTAWRRFARGVGQRMPKGLYARAILIVVLPMALLQGVVAGIYADRHWQTVTRQLSEGLARDVAALVAARGAAGGGAADAAIAAIARDNLDLDARWLPPGPLPAPVKGPLFAFADPLPAALATRLRRNLPLPFWTDTFSHAGTIEIRVALPDATLDVVAPRERAYAANSRFFVLWTVFAALALIGVALAFLRNQVRPIQRLAAAAEAFGKGRPSPYAPQGAAEVRRAGYAFLEMRRRVERAVAERTQFLAGVSHDLRTVLTRFRLSLALLPKGPDAEALQRDAVEMERMLASYLDFARGDVRESASAVDVAALAARMRDEAARRGRTLETATPERLVVALRPAAFKRCLDNLVLNAERHATRVTMAAARDGRFLVVDVDDDGPGIAPESREDVFRPFVRLDEARNQDQAGSGLGLAIARDVARAHGGDVTLSTSPLGGLRASVRVPA